MNTTAISILLMSFTVMVVIGFHVSYSMMAVAVLTILYLGLLPVQIVNTMVDDAGGLTFLAIPFFILSNDIMARGGISSRLILLVDVMVGWMRGGLTMISIVVSIFSGGIFDSASTDAASPGATSALMMDKQGHDKEFATAVTITSGVRDMLIPPNHNVIICAMAAGGIPVSALFMAGLVPGVPLGVALMVFCHYLSVEGNYPKGTLFTLKNPWIVIHKSIWGLRTVIIVVVDVMVGVFTATESAAIACVYTLVVSMVGYREVSGKDLFGVVKSSAKTLSIVLALIVAPDPFGFCVTCLKILEVVVNEMFELTDNRFLILLMINLIILVSGVIPGMVSTIVIITPILMSVLFNIGFSPIQFGAVLVLNCGIGLVIPPVGGVLFIGGGIFGVPIGRLSRHTLSLIRIMTVVLLMITYIPEITLTLSRTLGLSQKEPVGMDGGTRRVIEKACY